MHPVADARPAAELAKAALRRLAQARLEPTPENYARAWAEEAGGAAAPNDGASTAAPGGAAGASGPAADGKAQGPAWAALIDKLTRQLERGGRQWTTARRKDSLQRVLQSSRSDAERLLQRLQALVQSWDVDRPADAPEVAAAEPAPEGAAEAPAVGPAEHTVLPAAVPPAAADVAWPGIASTLHQTLQHGLPAADERAAEIAARLRRLADRLAGEGTSAALAQELDAVCTEAARWFGRRHELVDQLVALCRGLAEGITELAEDESWARGQAEQVRACLEPGPSRRALHAAGELLHEARQRQRHAHAERTAAREALQELLARMLAEVGELGRHTGSFELAVQRHAEAITSAQSLEGLTGVVQAMLADSRSVSAAVRDSRARLHQQHDHARELEQRVRELEAELRRISNEACTDALTQVANRRGLERAFAAEAARAARAAAAGDPPPADGVDAPAAPAATASRLAIGLIDIDNFKKLNDRLGHAAGDTALKSLATAVRERLRPVDHLARFGGEEFVLLLPDAGLDEAQQALTRLQRSLSASLFLHEGEEVFVTFSAGVTAWRPGEALQAALARADEALYEAKRTGKNRTCKA